LLLMQPFTLFGTTSFPNPVTKWQSGAGNWRWANSQVITGDFEGDKNDDIAVLYDYGNDDTGLWVFQGTANGIAAPSRRWRSGAGNWRWANAKPVAGDFDGNGR